jgi:hypothetical protein
MNMTVKALPRSSLEVVEAEFLFQLLMGLFAAHRALMVAAKVHRSPPGGQVSEVVFLLC